MWVQTKPTTVCVVGSVNLDHSYTVAELPRPGQTVLASGVATAPGGKGGNQAVAAARAGASVHLVAALGDDAAAVHLRAHLTGNGVDVASVVTAPVASGSAVIVVDSEGENSIVVAPGANAHLTMTSAAARAAVAGADVLLLQLEIPLDTAVAAARVAGESGTVVIVNASPAQSGAGALEDLAAVADVVVVNEDEAAHWRWPVPHLVTTLGARGARYAGGGRSVSVPSPAVEPVDSTGAGDVFAGVLATHWLSGPDVALRRACAAGALATLVAGAGDCAPTAEAIDDVLATETTSES